MCEQFKACGALRAKMAARYGRRGITFNRHQLSRFVVDQLSATDGAIRAHGAGQLGVVNVGAQSACLVAHRFNAGSIGAGGDLSKERPFAEQLMHWIFLWGLRERSHEAGCSKRLFNQNDGEKRSVKIDCVLSRIAKWL